MTLLTKAHPFSFYAFEIDLANHPEDIYKLSLTGVRLLGEADGFSVVRVDDISEHELNMGPVIGVLYTGYFEVTDDFHPRSPPLAALAGIGVDIEELVAKCKIALQEANYV